MVAFSAKQLLICSGSFWLTPSKYFRTTSSIAAGLTGAAANPCVGVVMIVTETTKEIAKSPMKLEFRFVVGGAMVNIFEPERMMMYCTMGDHGS